MLASGPATNRTRPRRLGPPGAAGRGPGTGAGTEATMESASAGSDSAAGPARALHCPNVPRTATAARTTTRALRRPMSASRHPVQLGPKDVRGHGSLPHERPVARGVHDDRVGLSHETEPV